MMAGYNTFGGVGPPAAQLRIPVVAYNKKLKTFALKLQHQWKLTASYINSKEVHDL